MKEAFECITLVSEQHSAPTNGLRKTRFLSYAIASDHVFATGILLNCTRSQETETYRAIHDLSHDSPGLGRLNLPDRENNILKIMDSRLTTSALIWTVSDTPTGVCGYAVRSCQIPPSMRSQGSARLAYSRSHSVFKSSMPDKF